MHTQAPAALRPRDAAAYLGIGLSTLWHKAKTDPDFPPLIKLGPRTTILIREALDAYVARCATRGEG